MGSWMRPDRVALATAVLLGLAGRASAAPVPFGPGHAQAPGGVLLSTRLSETDALTFETIAYDPQTRAFLLDDTCVFDPELSEEEIAIIHHAASSPRVGAISQSRFVGVPADSEVARWLSLADTELGALAWGYDTRLDLTTNPDPTYPNPAVRAMEAAEALDLRFLQTQYETAVLQYEPRLFLNLLGVSLTCDHETRRIRASAFATEISFQMFQDIGGEIGYPREELLVELQPHVSASVRWLSQNFSRVAADSPAFTQALRYAELIALLRRAAALGVGVQGESALHAAFEGRNRVQVRWADYASQPNREYQARARLALLRTEHAFRARYDGLTHIQRLAVVTQLAQFAANSDDIESLARLKAEADTLVNAPTWDGAFLYMSPFRNTSDDRGLHRMAFQWLVPHTLSARTDTALRALEQRDVAWASEELAGASAFCALPSMANADPFTAATCSNARLAQRLVANFQADPAFTGGEGPVLVASFAFSSGGSALTPDSLERAKQLGPQIEAWLRLDPKNTVAVLGSGVAPPAATGLLGQTRDSAALRLARAQSVWDALSGNLADKTRVSTPYATGSSADEISGEPADQRADIFLVPRSDVFWVDLVGSLRALDPQPPADTALSRALGQGADIATRCAAGRVVPLDRPAVRVSVSVEWADRQLDDWNLGAIKAFREATPGIPLTHLLSIEPYANNERSADDTRVRLDSVIQARDEVALLAAIPVGGSAADATAIAEKAREMLTSHGFSVSRTFRARNGLASAAVLEGVRAAGFLVDTSATDPRWQAEERSGSPEFALLESLWPDVTPTTQPFDVDTPAGTLLEVPNGGALADYVTPAEIEGSLRAAITQVQRESQDVYLHFGFQEQTADQYARALSGALCAVVETDEVPIVFETVSQSAAHLRRANEFAERSRVLARTLALVAALTLALGGTAMARRRG